jgi:hypothetical protein
MNINQFHIEHTPVSSLKRGLLTFSQFILQRLNELKELPLPRKGLRGRSKFVSIYSKKSANNFSNQQTKRYQ